MSEGVAASCTHDVHMLQSQVHNTVLHRYHTKSYGVLGLEWVLPTLPAVRHGLRLL
jgi:hypothetical protein